MKKVLLGTSALIGAGFIAASAQAASPSVSVGGFIDFQVGISDQDLETGIHTRDTKFQNDTEVHVTVDGKTDSGLGYGAVIELEADIAADKNGEGVNADKTYLFLEGAFGRVEMGGNAGAEEALRVDASTFARAVGGIDGDWYLYANPGAGTYVLRPNLPTEHSITTLGSTGAGAAINDASKLTYYTPRYSGVQLGVSYTPDQGDGNLSGRLTGDTATDYEDVFGIGLHYEGQYDNVGISASATGEFGDHESAAMEDLEAYALGLNVSFAGFTVGGSYGDWQESGQATGSTADSDYWTLGAAYEVGPFAASITYLNSEFTTSELDNISIGADYQLAPGLVPYVEVSFFDFDLAGTTGDNDGTVVLLGTELSF